jgi:hypothetical protein
MEKFTVNSSAAVTLFHRHHKHSGLFIGWNAPVSGAESAKAIFCRDRGRKGMFADGRASPQGASAGWEPRHERTGFAEGF